MFDFIATRERRARPGQGRAAAIGGWLPHVLLPCVLLAAGCATLPDQRAYYHDAIEKFALQDKAIPDASSRCWLAPDLVGKSAGDNAIAEEEFVTYLLKTHLCRVVEKHPDATAGYSWPESDRCPCPAGVQPCGLPGAAAVASPSVPGGLPFSLPFGGGSASAAGSAGDDNNRSNDKLLERYKKSTMPDKLIVYRIDEMTGDHCVIYFRVSDVKKADGTVEAAEVVTVTPHTQSQ